MSDSTITEILPENLTSGEDFSVTVVDQIGTVAFEQAVKLNNPFEFNPERFHPGQAAPTLDKFLELITSILIDKQVREEVVLAERVQLTDEYPMERFDQFGEEVITYRLISRKPANMSADGKSRQQKGFGFSYHLRSPEFPDKVIIVDSRPVDHIIEFSCWSKRARLANRRALWLEKLLIDQTWALQVQGVDRFIWEERLADTYYNVGGQPLYQRPLRFFVRLNEFRSKAEQVLAHINLEVQAADDSLLRRRTFI